MHRARRQQPPPLNPQCELTARGQQASALLTHTITKDTRSPLQAEPGTCLAARIHGAHVIGPGSPAWPRPNPGSRTTEASRASGTGLCGQPGGSARGKRLGREPNTHSPPSRSRRRCRRASAGPGPWGWPARWARRGTSAGTDDWPPAPRPAPIWPRPLAGVRKELRAHVRLRRPFSQSYVVSRKLGPRVWSAVQDCVTGREPQYAHAQEAATAALRRSVARLKWG